MNIDAFCFQLANNSLECVDKYVGDINAISSGGYTPLYASIIGGYKHTQALLERGANPFSVNGDDETTLQRIDVDNADECAITHEIIRRARELGTTSDFERVCANNSSFFYDGTLWFRETVYVSWLSLVHPAEFSQLVESAKTCGKKLPLWTILDDAVYSCNEAQVKQLLDAGVNPLERAPEDVYRDVSVQDDDVPSLITVARDQGNKTILRMLLQKSIDCL